MRLARKHPTRERGAAVDVELAGAVAAIVGEVRERGDAGLRELAERFDRRSPGPDDSYEIGADRWRRAAESVSSDIAGSLGRAAARIRRFHGAQTAAGYDHDDGELGLRVVPLARVGIYVPGGTALYPSSVLMNAIPAVIAGVDEVIMVTPGASPEALLAARVAGVTRVFELGGAHAVAALAFGTETVPRVDKIVGPGNRWVAEAKRQVFGYVDIDSIAGPSEVVIVADETANPRWIAADLIAQAEHDVDAQPILIALGEDLAAAVDAALESQLADLPRAEIARAALENNGAAVVVGGLEEAIAIAEGLAPEHLELMIDGARAVAETIRFAGAVFVGAHSPEAAGDYVAGPNHVLPTAGSARFASPLGVYDFVKRVSLIDLTRPRLAELADDIIALAGIEGLEGHARSVRVRFEGETDG